MKIKITYQSGEEKLAYCITSFAKWLLCDLAVKVKETDAHPPYRHIYISSKPPEVAPK